MERICNKPETGCDLDCYDCEIPGITPEDCEHCMEEFEDNDMVYTSDFYYRIDTWYCYYCDRPV